MSTARACRSSTGETLQTSNLSRVSVFLLRWASHATKKVDRLPEIEPPGAPGVGIASRASDHGRRAFSRLGPSYTAETLTRILRPRQRFGKLLILLEATPGIEPGYTVLQTVA